MMPTTFGKILLGWTVWSLGSVAYAALVHMVPAGSSFEVLFTFFWITYFIGTPALTYFWVTYGE